MEERFRDEIKRYVRRPGVPNITPKQIPPLISISGNLPPTARNNRFNAIVKDKNFGGSWSMPTLTASKTGNLRQNIRSLENLLMHAGGKGFSLLGGGTGAANPKSIAINCAIFLSQNEAVVEFLKEYRWLEDEFNHPARPPEVELQLDFLTKAAHGITSWLVVAPQMAKESFGNRLLAGNLDLTVKQRGRLRGFKVFGESKHRAIAEFLMSLEFSGKLRIASPNPATVALADKTRGVMLLYPVREKEKDLISVGFELLFPKNDLPYDLNLTVEREDRSTKIVVEKQT